MARALLPSAIRNLLEDFTRLPGIGPRSAERIVFALLGRPKEDVERFARDVRALSTTVVCETCGLLSEEVRCTLCRDPQRDAHTLCVVESALDVIAIERTGSYEGRYHVLGGVLSPLENIRPEDLRITSLLERVATTRPREIILALNPSTEGETTALYLQEALAGCGAKLTRLAQGLPTGASLEFADDLTITRALTDRKALVKPTAVRARGEGA